MNNYLVRSLLYSCLPTLHSIGLRFRFVSLDMRILPNTVQYLSLPRDYSFHRHLSPYNLLNVSGDYYLYVQADMCRPTRMQ